MSKCSRYYKYNKNEKKKKTLRTGISKEEDVIEDKFVQSIFMKFVGDNTKKVRLTVVPGFE